MTRPRRSSSPRPRSRPHTTPSRRSPSPTSSSATRSAPPAPSVYSREFASAYDSLRPRDERWWAVLEALVEMGDLAGRRVLDVGCGTGAPASALRDRGADVSGVDASAEMLREAHARGLPRDRFVHGRAEALPFPDGAFERTLMRLVAHHVDRSRAFAELHRVLEPGGRAVVATLDPDGFDGFWLDEIFPEVGAIDRARFPSEHRLVEELGAAGFANVAATRHHERGSLTRAEALERVRGRFISTLRLLDEETFARGLARAERDLPPTVEADRPWLLVTAERRAVEG